MLKTLIRPALIVAAFAAGYCVPEAKTLTFLIRYLLLVMLYFVCLQVKPVQLKPHKSHWKILAANIVIGVVAWGGLLLSGQTVLSGAAFFTGITPTASAAPVIIRFLGGNVSYVVVAFLITNVGISAALLGLIPLVTGNYTLGFFGDVAGNLLIIMGIPALLALFTRKWIPSSREWPAKLPFLSFTLWLAMLFITAGSASSFIRNTPDLPPMVLLEIAGISLGLCAVNFIVGYFLGEWRFRRESSQSLGQKNTMFTLYLALTFTSPLAAMGPTFYVLWHNLWNAMQMFFHDRRTVRRKKKRCTSCENAQKNYIDSVTRELNP